ncbi:ABC transporter ATP-binding protein [Rhodococcus fascians]|uniref:ABC transporter ATP-binding protein n=1 Tax=Rhodococcoides fascians TaxID=1828 RepID=UPI001960E1EC|nr:ABC transporter ATP-binding protein [Rhodococcus fascians]MBM7245949.1 ABC transporter ATP-binding protein [Rhodococcus fascians]MBY3808098.1 ABC transporter ATP-binding protein [Rhodococcus fascians]MBY3843453.1 ABC transporter ATP-binding protein [Rhodococcus fascians]MBY3847764.1 ABC transporter ATP-binding protein [Rhodococcus fascians]MBY3853026.1 ABC transporter ATP-binding protein [Rhodococcus fascians]
MTDAIAVDDLVKTFGSVRALDGLNLHVEAGDVHGFLGPNGSGKSTTIRVLLGLVRATSGTVRLLGGDPWADGVALHRRLAYVPGDVTLWPSLTGGEVIDLLARMRGGIDSGRRAELIERFSLDPGKRSRTYSKGNRQKVALISALASNVELLLLDEPTSGLDPLMEQQFAECVKDAARRGVTVLLSSHILSEVDALCSSVTIVRDGRTVDTGTLASMRHLTRTTMTITVDRVPGDLDRLTGVSGVTVDGSTITCTVENEALAAVMHVLADAGVQSMISSAPTLEELFLRYYA